MVRASTIFVAALAIAPVLAAPLTEEYTQETTVRAVEETPAELEARKFRFKIGKLLKPLAKIAANAVVPGAGAFIPRDAAQDDIIDIDAREPVNGAAPGPHHVHHSPAVHTGTIHAPHTGDHRTGTRPHGGASRFGPKGKGPNGKYPHGHPGKGLNHGGKPNGFKPGHKGPKPFGFKGPKPVGFKGPKAPFKQPRPFSGPLPPHAAHLPHPRSLDEVDEVLAARSDLESTLADLIERGYLEVVEDVEDREPKFRLGNILRKVTQVASKVGGVAGKVVNTAAALGVVRDFEEDEFEAREFVEVREDASEDFDARFDLEIESALDQLD